MQSGLGRQLVALCLVLDVVVKLCIPVFAHEGSLRSLLLLNQFHLTWMDYANCFINRIGEINLIQVLKNISLIWIVTAILDWSVPTQNYFLLCIHGVEQCTQRLSGKLSHFKFKWHELDFVCQAWANGGTGQWSNGPMKTSQRMVPCTITIKVHGTPTLLWDRLGANKLFLHRVHGHAAIISKP